MLAFFSGPARAVRQSVTDNCQVHRFTIYSVSDHAEQC
jgi:hypothetical protein